MKIAGFIKMFPRTYRPPHMIVRAPRASKLSTDDIKATIILFRKNKHFLRKYTHQETSIPNPKYGKCENSAKNWPDYMKITPQNSTDYVKSRRKFIQICDLQIANLDSNIIENYEKVTPILIFS